MRQGVSTAALAASALALLALAPGAAGLGGFSEAPFCKRAVLKDYEAPLRGLPSVRHTPRSGKLPFAPRISFGRLRGPKARSSPTMVVGDESIEYGIWDGRKGGAGPLRWTADSRLVRISGRGRELSVVKHRIEHLEDLRSGDHMRIGFTRAPAPGTYRYDLAFRGPGGRLLGEFHDYYDVYAEDHDVRIALNAKAFAPGEQLLAKVENFGTDQLFYGVDFSIEREIKATWVPVELKTIFGPNIGFILIGLKLPPGMSDDCSSGFTVPAAMEPGTYRIVKRFDGYPPETASAEFTVMPAT